MNYHLSHTIILHANKFSMLHCIFDVEL